MDDNLKKMADGLTKAIQAEIDGYHFYMMAAQSTSDEQGREVFQRLAQDEMEHAQFLRAHYRALVDTGKPDPTAKLGPPTKYEGDHPIFSPSIRSRIRDAHYEMSALSIGSQLELSAIDFYEAEAVAATNPGVSAFYRELANWESGHYHALLAQMNALKEDYWEGGGFSPF